MVKLLSPVSLSSPKEEDLTEEVPQRDSRPALARSTALSAQ